MLGLPIWDLEKHIPGSLQSGSLQSGSYGFWIWIAKFWESTVWESIILGLRISDLDSQILGVYSLESRILGLRISDLDSQILGVYSLGVYNSRATDFGSG